MAILLLADHNNKTLGTANAKAMTAAKALGGEVHILVAGADCKSVAESAAKLAGADKVLLAEGPHLANALAEEVAALIVPLMVSYDALVSAATASGKNCHAAAACWDRGTQWHQQSCLRNRKLPWPKTP